MINNAGYGLFGMIEEVTEEQARAQIETNLFGAAVGHQGRAAEPAEQGSGHILQVSSIGGVNAFPALGLYHASKWALEAFSQSLGARGRPFGIYVTLIEPAGFSTDWRGPSAVQAAALRPTTACARPRPAVRGRNPPAGDPEATAAAILEVLDAEEPPLRVFLGVGRST